MAQVTWNYVAEGLAETSELLVAALVASVGSPVRVAPLDDEVSADMGVWIRGDKRDVDQVRETLEEDLDKRQLTWSGLEWQMPLEAGK